MKLSFIGSGNMANALIGGLYKDYEIEVFGIDVGQLNNLNKKYGVKVYNLNENFDISNKNLILCFKPNNLDKFITQINGKANSVISILAGTKLEKLKQISANYYIRVMPNIAALYQKSASVVTGSSELKEEILNIFSKIGNVLWVNSEKEVDIATAIIGSGPAFLAIVAEAISDGGVLSGLNKDTALKLTSFLFESATELLKNEHPAIIKDKVSSPGGTTIEGVRVLEDKKIRSALIEAINSAYEKAKKLS